MVVLASIHKQAVSLVPEHVNYQKDMWVGHRLKEHIFWLNRNFLFGGCIPHNLWIQINSTELCFTKSLHSPLNARTLNISTLITTSH